MTTNWQASISDRTEMWFTGSTPTRLARSHPPVICRIHRPDGGQRPAQHLCRSGREPVVHRVQHRQIGKVTTSGAFTEYRRHELRPSRRRADGESVISPNTTPARLAKITVVTITSSTHPRPAPAPPQHRQGPGRQPLGCRTGHQRCAPRHHRGGDHGSFDSHRAACPRAMTARLTATSGSRRCGQQDRPRHISGHHRVLDSSNGGQLPVGVTAPTQTAKSVLEGTSDRSVASPYRGHHGVLCSILRPAVLRTSRWARCNI